ncbi:MAG: RNA polymerase factor sigma-32 [Bdellovibrionota bacterium]
MTEPKKRKKTPENQGSSQPSNLPVPAKERDVLQIYIRELSRLKLLTPEEEKHLTTSYFESHDPALFRRLVQANLRFVVKIAFEYASYGAKVMDLIQEGNLGLMKAVQDFNPYKEVRLTTYAVWWIRSYMQDYLLRNWSLVRIGTTAAQKKLFYRLKKEQQRLEQMGVRPEPKQIAMNLGVEERDVKLMQERLSGGDVSISTPIRDSADGGDSSFNIENRFADQSELSSETLEKSEQAQLFKKALEEFVLLLDEREQAIFRERLLSEKPRTLLEIGDDYKITKERARQIEEKIKKKLKDFLAEKYPDISVD